MECPNGKNTAVEGKGLVPETIRDTCPPAPNPIPYLRIALAHAPDDTPNHHDAAHSVESAIDLGLIVAHKECAEGEQEEAQHDEADSEGLLISHGD